MRSLIHGAVYKIDSALNNKTHHKKIKYFGLENFRKRLQALLLLLEKVFFFQQNHRTADHK